MNFDRAKSDRDYLFSLFLGLGVVIFAGFLLYEGLTWLWHWFVNVNDEGSIGLAIWNLCKSNLSILIVIYGIISLQVSGLAELKFDKNFLKAFGLALILTPPVMMAVYGHRKTDDHG
ncbi:MAG: hypothetical protein ACE5EE_11115 [Fidelibacterota bacterium]